MSKLSKIQSYLDNPFVRDRFCPRCVRGKLLKKSGKFGFFLGCNRFPECSYTQKMNEKQIKAIKEFINDGGIL